MKNLYIYISPRKKFESDKWNNELSLLPKIQIDNSLELGWKPKDIILVTNFDYEYRGVKSIVVPDSCYSGFKPTTTKIKTIIYLIETGYLKNHLYWFHDLDAFQLKPFTEEEIIQELKGADLGLTDYGRSSINRMRDKRWSTGSLFFYNEAKYIFDIWWKVTKFYECNEEVALLEALKKPRFYYLKKKIERMNVTWNMGTRKRDIKGCYEIAEKPLRVLHFHPFDDRLLTSGDGNNLETCMYGKSRLGKPLMTKGLIKLFNKYNIS